MSEISTDDMLKWLNDDILDFKERIEEGDDTLEKVLRYTTAIRDFIQKHSDPDMVMVPREFFLALSQLLNSTTDMCNPDGRFWNLDLSETRCVSLRNAIENAKRIVEAAKGE